VLRGSIPVAAGCSTAGEGRVRAWATEVAAPGVETAELVVVVLLLWLSLLRQLRCGRLKFVR
jgi:hypothetical protein